MTVDPLEASGYTTDKIHLPTSSFGKVSPKTRARAAERGEAMPDGSFPIRDGADLKRAIKAWGRAKDKGGAKRHIMRRAKALDKIDLLPTAWKEAASQEFSHTPVAKKEPENPIDVALRAKAEKHNAQVSDERKVSLPKLRAVYKRGLAASAAELSSVLTPDQQAHARVNSFLRLLQNGKPDREDYTQDNDLLPAPPPFFFAASDGGLTAAIDHNPINPEFELLHPRGRDGEWIEKGGIIKIHGHDGKIHIGTVDAVASDGSINVTLHTGVKANAQPHQVEQLHEVARLDAPPPVGNKVDPPEALPVDHHIIPVIPDMRLPGNTYDGGPTGDFKADSARVEGLIEKYAEAGLDTETLFDKVDGKPWKFRRTRERDHERIINEFLNREGVKKERKILIMGGMPGAGKTTFLNSPEGQKVMGVNLGEYVTVNPDEVKARMIELGLVPHYPGLTDEEAAVLIHNESSQIAWLIMHRALAQDHNIAYDATLRTPLQAEELLTPAKGDEPPPHDTTMVLIDVTVQEAIDRAIKRYNEGGRYLPPDFIAGMTDPQHGSVPRASYEDTKQYVDHAILVDNSSFTSGPKILENSAQPDQQIPRAS